MLNKSAYIALSNLNDLTIIRIYPNSLPHVTSLEFVIMLAGNDITETSNFASVYFQINADMNDWVSYSEDISFGGNGTIEILVDDDGKTYVEWKNVDFLTPFEISDYSVQERLSYYAS